MTATVTAAQFEAAARKMASAHVHGLSEQESARADIEEAYREGPTAESVINIRGLADALATLAADLEA